MFHRGNGIRRLSRAERPVFPLISPQEPSVNNDKVYASKKTDPPSEGTN